MLGEGPSMPKRKEPAKEDQQFTCSNATCGFVFSKPIKVINLRETKSASYDACPRCLTEIVMGAAPSIDLKPEIDTETEPLETKPKLKDKKAESQPAGSCAHHFGYLSEQSRNENIPDECVMCANIVKCMLKTVNG
jgi:hypothetical protein